MSRARGETVRINITLTADELAEIDQAAQRAGLDRSSFLRQAALHWARRRAR